MTREIYCVSICDAHPAKAKAKAKACQVADYISGVNLRQLVICSLTGYMTSGPVEAHGNFSPGA